MKETAELAEEQLTLSDLGLKPEDTIHVEVVAPTQKDRNDLQPTGLIRRMTRRQIAEAVFMSRWSNW